MPFISTLKESFAIAPIKDRESVVQKLATANTDDAIYYQALIVLQKIYDQVMKHSQPVTPRQATAIELELSKEMTNLLSKLPNWNEHYQELNTRYHLLIYPFNTTVSLEYIRKELHLDLLDIKKPIDNQQESPQILCTNKSTAPSALDTRLINGQHLIKKSFASLKEDPYSTLDLDPLAFPHLSKDIWDGLSDQEQVALVKRLLVYPTQNTFGSVLMDRFARLWKVQQASPELNWNLHEGPLYNLTLMQLDQLIEAIPEVAFLHDTFIEEYMSKLVPSQLDGSFWNDDGNEMKQYLERLQDFVEKLPPLYFQLKSAVKFHLLRVDITRGEFSEERFVSYLASSSNKSNEMSPVPSRPKFFGSMSTSSNISNNINIDRVNTSITIPHLGNCNITINDKNEVAEEYLSGLIAHGKLSVSIESLGAYIDYHNFLKKLHAKIMLTTTSSATTQWVQILGSEAYESLVSESFVTFTAATLNTSFKRKPTDTVSLQVKAKNIPRLSIRVFQIDTENYWRLHMNDDDERASNNKINLDGLCTTFEKDLDYSSEAAIRVKTTVFKFGPGALAPDVFKGRGLWVVEFVGGQNQCRSIVQKGYLNHVMQKTSAGHLVRVLDEESQVLENAKIWYDNQYYETDESKNILIPYLSHEKEARMGKMILMASNDDDTFCQPASFYQLTEKYKLEADFYVNPEMVYVNKKATAIVIPRLSLNGIALPTSSLEKVSLSVDCTNANEIKNSATCQNIGSDPHNIYFEFMVPDQLTVLEFQLKAQVKTLDNNSFQSIDANHIIHYDPVANKAGIPVSIHLKQSADNKYTIHAFGKNGELKKNHEITLDFKHAFVGRKISAFLKTNEQGFIELGELNNIQWIEYSDTMGTYKQWHLFDDGRALLPPAVCTSANTDFKILCTHDFSDSLYSLYKNGDNMKITDDCSSKIKKETGYIQVQGLSQGQYTLYVASADGDLNQIQCTVIDNKADFSKQDFWSQWLVGTNKSAKHNGKLLQKPLSIASTDVTDASITINVQNGSSKAFVVVTTTTFVPSNEETLASRLLGGRSLTRPLVQEDGVQSTRSIFLDDKRIGEEYQYILNRSRSEQWVGSNLTKPSLLLYPKKKASTNSSSRHLEQGYTKSSQIMNNAKMGFFKRMAGYADPCCMSLRDVGSGRDASLGFLDHDSPILVLPISSDDGSVTIDRSNLGYGGQILQVVAISGDQAVSHTTVLDGDQSLRCKDLRQKEDSNKALIRSKVVSKVMPNDSLLINTHEYEVLDSVEKLFDTIKTISRVGDVLASEFNFLKTWPSLSLEKKLELHEKNVCHEFNLWLKKKDALFFNNYVKPALKSKIQKTFMDSYLVDDDLSDYCKDVYHYQQLSVVEKALLATTQSPEFLQTVLRAFKEEFDDKKVDDRSDIIFDSILAGNALALPEIQFDSVTDCVVMDKSATELQSVDVPTNSTNPLMYSRAVPLSAAFGSAIPPPAAPGASFLRVSEPASVSYSAGSPVVASDEEESYQDNEEEAANALRERERSHQKKVTYKFSEATSEWVEHDAYNDDEVVLLQKFWINYLEYFATKSQENTFLSENFMFSLNNVTEILYVLSLMDLPFASEANWTATTETSSANKGSFTITTSSQPLMVFYRSLGESQDSFTSNSTHNLMLGQELFVMDMFTPIDSEECIKINPDSQNLEPFVEYGNHLIVSNVSSKLLTCQVTLQVPTGAVPSQATPYCISKTISIDAYSTWHEVVSSFYFPAAGEFSIVPVTVSTSSGRQLLGKIDAVNVRVVDRDHSNNEIESAANTTVSWSVLANNGSNASIVSFLDSYRKLDKLDFSLIGWRMTDRNFARQVFDVLVSRYFFSRDLWQYGVYHQFQDIVRDLLNFLKHDMLNQVGKVFESPLISTDSLNHQHELLVLDYYPLLNARAHPLKSTSEILNQQFYRQYDEYLSYLSLKTSPLGNADLLILTLYLLLQDRIGEAHATFARLTEDENQDMYQVQKDYLGAYLKTRIRVTKGQQQMQQLDLQSIKEVTRKYEDFGVLKWRQLFANLHDFVCEVEQGDLAVSDNSSQNKRIQSEPILEFEVNERNQELIVQYANLKSIDIKYYEMNIEVMFSNNPFMGSGNRKSTISHENFTWIKPSHSVTMELPEKQLQKDNTNDEDFDIIGVGKVNALQTAKIPFTGGNKNVFIEISNGSLMRRQAYYANSLHTHIAESFGVVRVMSAKTKRPLAGAYVKVYARMKNGGQVEFWKDGYTGLNGVFDYIGVTEGNNLMGDSNVELKTLMDEKIEKLSILILSAEEGAVVKEAYPPLCT